MNYLLQASENSFKVNLSNSENSPRPSQPTTHLTFLFQKTPKQVKQ